MKQNIIILLLLFFFTCCTQSAFAMPEYMSQFNAVDKDKRLKNIIKINKNFKNNCTACHANSSGGGSRNGFGQIYESKFKGKSFSLKTLRSLRKELEKRGKENLFDDRFTILDSDKFLGVAVTANTTFVLDATALEEEEPTGTITISLTEKPTELAEGELIRWILSYSKKHKNLAKRISLEISPTRGAISFDENGIVEPSILTTSYNPQKFKKPLKKDLKIKFSLKPSSSLGRDSKLKFDKSSLRGFVLIEAEHGHDDEEESGHDE